VVATTVADAVGELYTQRFNSNRVAIEYRAGRAFLNTA
jgi:hypothetical protein